MNQPKRTRKELRGAIIGMVMGDASLYQNSFRDGSKRGNYKLDISHGLKQKSYLEWKRNIVNTIFDYEIPIKNRLINNKKTGKTYSAVRFQTRVHPRFKFIATRIYQQGVKRITDWVLDNITLEGLSYWWQDDGCLFMHKPPQSSGVVVWGLYGFPKEDVEKLGRWLADRYDIRLNMNYHKKSDGWCLRRGLSEGMKLCDLLKPYCAPSMEYKFNYGDKVFSNRASTFCSNNSRGSAYLLRDKDDEIIQAA